jgi:hypothetical protein
MCHVTYKRCSQESQTIFKWSLSVQANSMTTYKWENTPKAAVMVNLESEPTLFQKLGTLHTTN